MLEEVARILRAYKDLRDSRLNDLLEVGRNATLFRDTLEVYCLWCRLLNRFSVQSIRSNMYILHP